jgi:hypothetical protein
MTGTLTSGQANVTGLVAVGAAPFPGVVFAPFVGQPVSGTGVATGATVLSVQSSTAITLSANATANGATALTFGTEPITLADAKLHCRIEYPDDDALVTSLITAARRHCETQLRQALITQTWLMYLDSFPLAGGYYNPYIRQQWASYSGNAFGGGGSGVGFYPGMFPNSTGVLDIPMSPLQSVNSVQYVDFNAVTQTVSPAVYVQSLGIPGRIQPNYAQVWPIARPTIDSVQINFTCGYGPVTSNVGENVKAAMKLMIGSWYEHRENVQVGQFMVVPQAALYLLAIDDPGIYC